MQKGTIEMPRELTRNEETAEWYRPEGLLQETCTLPSFSSPEISSEQTIPPRFWGSGHDDKKLL